jgi:GxxExxY protein
MEVHRNLGAGFLEPVYQEALAIEFDIRGIQNDREVQLPIRNKGLVLASRYRVDFVCFGDVLVELKALGRHFRINLRNAISVLVPPVVNDGTFSIDVLGQAGSVQLEEPPITLVEPSGRQMVPTPSLPPLPEINPPAPK